MSCIQFLNIAYKYNFGKKIRCIHLAGIKKGILEILYHFTVHVSDFDDQTVAGLFSVFCQADHKEGATGSPR